MFSSRVPPCGKIAPFILLREKIETFDQSKKKCFQRKIIKAIFKKVLRMSKSV